MELLPYTRVKHSMKLGGSDVMIAGGYVETVDDYAESVGRLCVHGTETAVETALKLAETAETALKANRGKSACANHCTVLY